MKLEISKTRVWKQMVLQYKLGTWSVKFKS